MELLLLGLAAMALFKEEPKDKKAQRRRKESRRRAKREREKYWEDAHWWHLNHGD